MTSAIVFVSRFRIKPGAREAFEAHVRSTTSELERDKPRTALFGVYLSDSGDEVSFVHVFADAAALDDHLAGARERNATVAPFLERLDAHVYGAPSAAAAGMLRAAFDEGRSARTFPSAIAGFSRLPSP
jgi:quinol monooxygenase YgiN